VNLRQKPRIEFPFPVLVRGTDAEGERFEVETAFGFLSASGLYVRLCGRTKEGCAAAQPD